MNKLSTSNEVILAVAKKAVKVVKSLTGRNYKPKSFEELRKLQDHWHRKMSQRDKFVILAKNIKMSNPKTNWIKTKIRSI